MRYKDRDELVADLRELADLLESIGHKLPMELWYPKSFGARFYESDETKPVESMKKVAKTIGKAEKVFNTDFELVRKMENGHVQLRYETQRENVCKKVVVGTEQVPKRVFVTIPNEYEDKEIVEWECDEPLLSN